MFFFLGLISCHSHNNVVEARIDYTIIDEGTHTTLQLVIQFESQNITPIQGMYSSTHSPLKVEDKEKFCGTIKKLIDQNDEIQFYIKTPSYIIEIINLIENELIPVKM